MYQLPFLPSTDRVLVCTLDTSPNKPEHSPLALTSLPNGIRHFGGNIFYPNHAVESIKDKISNARHYSSCFLNVSDFIPTTQLVQ